MLEAIINPLQFAGFVLVALFLNWRSESVAWIITRNWFFLLFNLLVLGCFLGTWKGLAFYLVYAVFFGWMARCLGPSRRYSGTLCVWLVILLVLGLAAAKYAAPYSVRGTLAVRHIWATISLSFLTFRIIHVVMDTHAGLIEKVQWQTFLNYVFFVPVSSAGPIQHYNDFEKGLSNPVPLSREAFVSAIQRIVIGIAKKVLIAAPLTPYVLGNMEPYGSHPFLILAAACLLYSIYIYADFSGYTDIAIGGAALLGIPLPENFNRPYLAVNVQDFWARWHMTFSEWLRVYLFYPVNKFLVQQFPRHARKADPVIAVIITFAIAGLWHGNTWNFLLFGLMHGLGIAFHFLIRKSAATRTPPSTGRTWLARALTISYVSAAWIPFVYPIEEIPWLLSQAWS